MWLWRPIEIEVGRVSEDPVRSCGARSTGLERETELLVLVRGRDEVVRVRLHAHGDADHHWCADAACGRGAASMRSISSSESTTIRPTP